VFYIYFIPAQKCKASTQGQQVVGKFGVSEGPSIQVEALLCGVLIQVEQL